MPVVADPERLSDEVQSILADHLSAEGPLLPILHALQARYGFVPPAALPQIGHALSLSRAEVYGVVTFYHDFRLAPAGRRVVKLCRAEACQAVGAEALAKDIQSRLGVGWGETTPDGRVTLEQVFCLGLCACGPAALVDGELVGRAEAGRLWDMLERGG